MYEPTAEELMQRQEEQQGDPTETNEGNTGKNMIYYLF